MIQNVLTHIDSVELYGAISISLFFAVFIGVLIRVLRLKKPYLNSMRELPLHDESAPEPAVTLTAKPEADNE